MTGARFALVAARLSMMTMSPGKRGTRTFSTSSNSRRRSALDQPWRSMRRGARRVVFRACDLGVRFRCALPGRPVVLVRLVCPRSLGDLVCRPPARTSTVAFAATTLFFGSASRVAPTDRVHLRPVRARRPRGGLRPRCVARRPVRPARLRLCPPLPRRCRLRALPVVAGCASLASPPVPPPRPPLPVSFALLLPPPACHWLFSLPSSTSSQ